MITRMNIAYRSKEPCNVKPEIFSTGGYGILHEGKELTFDFEDMGAGTRFENGYLFIESEQRNLDETVCDGVAPELVDRILRSAKKEDFTEIYYECFADSKMTKPVELEVESITFYDFTESGELLSIEVGGTAFTGLK